MDSYTLYIYSLTIWSGVIFLLLIIFMAKDFVFFFKENQKKQKLVDTKVIKENNTENVFVSTNIEKKNSIKLVDENQNLFVLKEVNSDYINRLNSIDIYSIKQLRNIAHTKEEIDTISKKTGIRKRLLDEWVRLGEFSRIQGIRQEHINLFEKVGIKTVHELKNADPKELYLLLFNLRNQGIIDSDIPTVGMISRWVRLSQDVPTKLKARARRV